MTEKSEHRLKEGIAKAIGSLDAWIDIIGSDVKRTEKFHKTVNLSMTKRTIKLMKMRKKNLERLLYVV